MKILFSRDIKSNTATSNSGFTKMWDSAMYTDANAPFTPEFWATGDRVLLYRGVPAVIKCTAQLAQEPRRWNDDPKQALTCTIASPQLVEWVQSLEAWLAPQLKGEFRSAAKANLFSEQFVRGKLLDDVRLFDAEGARTQNAPATGTMCQFLLQPRLYAMNGQTGVSIKVLAIQPKA